MRGVTFTLIGINIGLAVSIPLALFGATVHEFYPFVGMITMVSVICGGIIEIIEQRGMWNE